MSMKKEIFKKKINGKCANFSANEDEAFFDVANTKVHLYSVHDQDCCEHVYADYSVLIDHIPEIEGLTLKKLAVYEEKDMGFVVRFVGEEKTVKVFVPCYNYQNGYYSSDLAFGVSIGGQTTEIGIDHLVEDHID